MKGKITAVVASVVAAAGAAAAAAWARARRADEPRLEVGAAPEVAATPDAEAPPIGPDPASDPPSTSAAPVAGGDSDKTDDLTAIKGLGKVKAAKLAESGITTFAQIAEWTDADLADYGQRTNTSPGQIKREDWVGQAKALLKH
jgi:large subunit ribosomal protein L21